MPKPKIKVDLEQVERLAATGSSIEAISRVMGIGPRTLYRRREDETEVEKAFQRGRAKAHTAYANALREIALKKEGGEYVYDTRDRLKAITFFLERQPGWQKTERVDLQSTDGSMSPPPATVLPIDSLTPEEVARMARAAFKGEA